MSRKKKLLMHFKSSEEAITSIAAAAAYMGWGIAVPSDDDAVVEGLVIGTDEYINRILSDRTGD